VAADLTVVFVALREYALRPRLLELPPPRWL